MANELHAPTAAGDELGMLLRGDSGFEWVNDDVGEWSFARLPGCVEIVINFSAEHDGHVDINGEQLTADQLRAIAGQTRVVSRLGHRFSSVDPDDLFTVLRAVHAD